MKEMGAEERASSRAAVWVVQVEKSRAISIRGSVHVFPWSSEWRKPTKGPCTHLRNHATATYVHVKSVGNQSHEIDLRYSSTAARAGQGGASFRRGFIY